MAHIRNFCTFGFIFLATFLFCLTTRANVVVSPPASYDEVIEDTRIISNKDYPELRDMRMVDVLPQFPGGEAALINFLRENVEYPTHVALQGIQGRVLVSFIINTDGWISDVQVVNRVHPALDEEAMRVVYLMPKWTPGEVDGRKVRVQFVLPVSFRLQ